MLISSRGLFQEAIIITRRHGVEFLWIDSLCIIQDSVEDWAKEPSPWEMYTRMRSAILLQRQPLTVIEAVFSTAIHSWREHAGSASKNYLARLRNPKPATWLALIFGDKQLVKRPWFRELGFYKSAPWHLVSSALAKINCFWSAMNW